jgi:hypothetical protein
MVKGRNLMLQAWSRKLALLALLVISLALGSARAPVAADSGSLGVDIEVKAGFGELAVSRLGSWIPFRIVVTNQGPPIAGRLTVFAEAPSSHQSREFSEDVQLPTGSKKLYEIQAYLNSTQLDPVVRLIQHSSSGDKVLTETPVKIEQDSSVPGDQVQIAVIDTDETALNNVNSLPLEPTRVPFIPQPSGSGANVATQPMAPGPGPGPRYMYGRPLKGKPVVIDPADLPRGFASYDLLDAVVLNGAPLSQLDLEQGKALRLWVAEGGLLIVTGATDFPGLRPSGLDTLVPVDLVSTETVAGIPELTSLYGTFDSADPMLMTKARPRPGAKVLVGTTDRPLVVERSFGKGRVFYIAIDPKHNPFRGWKGSAGLWQDLLVPAAQFRQRRFSLGNLNGQLSSTLYDMADVKPPSAGHLLIFLIAYLLVVGPINYFGLRLLKKLDLAWVTIPLVVVVFTGFSIVAAQTSRGSDLVGSSVMMVEAYQQEGVSRMTGDLLLVFPSKSTHEVSFDNSAFINDSSSVAEGDPIVTTYRPDKTLLDVPTSKWAPVGFRVREVTEGQRPLVSVDTAQSGGSVMVKNLTNFPITRAVVIASGGLTDLFDLGPGEERQCELRAPATQVFYSWYSAALSGSQDAKVVQHIAGGFSYSGPYSGGNVMYANGDPLSSVPMPDLIKKLDRPLFVGLGDRNEPEFGYDGAVKRIARQLLIVHL